MPAWLRTAVSSSAAVSVPVVVPEDGKNGRLEPLNGLDESAHLLRVAVERQVAGEEDQIGLSPCVREDAYEPLVTRPTGMDVTRCGNPDHRRTVPCGAFAGNTHPWPSSTTCSRP